MFPVLLTPPPSIPHRAYPMLPVLTPANPPFPCSQYPQSSFPVVPVPLVTLILPSYCLCVLPVPSTLLPKCPAPSPWGITSKKEKGFLGTSP